MKGRRSSSWLVGPWTDLWVGCGLLSLPLIGVLPMLTAPLGRDVDLVFPGLALLVNYPHYAATLYRAYGNGDVFHRHRTHTVGYTLVLLGAGFVAMFHPFLIPVLLTLYMTWSPWHYSAQNHGVSLVMMRRLGVELSAVDIRGLKRAFMASSLIAMLFLHREGGGNDYLLSFHLPKVILAPISVLLFGFASSLFFRLLIRIVRIHGSRRALPLAALALSQMIWFGAFALTLLFPTMPYFPHALGAGEIALMHCAQYLWITSAQAKITSGYALPSWRYFLGLVGIGIALWLPLPWLMSRGFDRDFTLTLLTVTAVVNIHHFMLDGVIWRLREPAVRASLGLGEAGDGGEDRGRPVGGFVRLIVPARRLFSALSPALLAFGVCAALGLAGLDLTYLYHRHRLRQASHLDAALRMNSRDAMVQAALSRRLAERGFVDEARAHWRRAKELNPLVRLPHLNLTVVHPDDGGLSGGDGQ